MRTKYAGDVVAINAQNGLLPAANTWEDYTDVSALCINIDGYKVQCDEAISRIKALFSGMPGRVEVIALSVSVGTDCRGWDNKLSLDTEAMAAIVGSLVASPARDRIKHIDFSRTTITNNAADLLLHAALPSLVSLDLNIDSQTGGDDSVIWRPEIPATVKYLRMDMERFLYSAMFNLGTLYAQLDFGGIAAAQQLKELDVSWLYIDCMRLLNVNALAALINLKKLRLTGREHRDGVAAETYWQALKAPPNVESAEVASLAIDVAAEQGVVLSALKRLRVDRLEVKGFPVRMCCCSLQNEKGWMAALMPNLERLEGMCRLENGEEVQAALVGHPHLNAATPPADDDMWK